MQIIARAASRRRWPRNLRARLHKRLGQAAHVFALLGKSECKSGTYLPKKNPKIEIYSGYPRIIFICTYKILIAAFLRIL